MVRAVCFVPASAGFQRSKFEFCHAQRYAKMCSVQTFRLACQSVWRGLVNSNSSSDSLFQRNKISGAVSWKSDSGDLDCDGSCARWDNSSRSKLEPQSPLKPVRPPRTILDLVSNVPHPAKTVYSSSSNPSDWYHCVSTLRFSAGTCTTFNVSRTDHGVLGVSYWQYLGCSRKNGARWWSKRWSRETTSE